MRPGFYIPECACDPNCPYDDWVASMRPGFYIPECGAGKERGALDLGASMRPGFYIPECCGQPDFRHSGPALLQ